MAKTRSRLRIRAAREGAPGPAGAPLAIVSGLPRSGTSLLMQMLAAGGLPPLSDGLRAPDESNPRGYLEWEPVKRIREDPALLVQARGRVLKVVSALLPELPSQHRYRVLFATRPTAEIQASQRAMLRARGLADDRLSEAELEGHLDAMRAWMRLQPNLETCFVSYPELLADPIVVARRMRVFLDCELDVESMAAVVDPRLSHWGCGSR
ncbi:MAG: sulfotransferase family protein [Myxococcota bacterium]